MIPDFEKSYHVSLHVMIKLLPHFDYIFYHYTSFHAVECRERFAGSQKHSHLSTANNEDECEEVDGEWVEVHNFLEKLPLNEQVCLFFCEFS